MNSILNNWKSRAGIVALVIAMSTLAAAAQVTYTQEGATQLVVAGTSTMHNWEMVSKEAVYTAVFEANAQGKPIQLTSLTVSLPAESLKSGKTGMDKNAYSALKTDKYKGITFSLVKASMDAKTIRSTGKLTIAGTSRPTEIEATFAVRQDNSIQCKGAKKFLMTDFSVEPPSFMFGSVTTGDEVTISFDVLLVPKKDHPITLN